MKNKIVRSVFIIAIFIAIGISLFVFVFRLIQSRQIGKLKYTVEAYEPKYWKAENLNTCTLTYYDNINLNAIDKGELSNISVYVGKTKSPKDVVKKWANNVAKLKKQYEDATKGKWISGELYGNFLWTNRPTYIRLRYRTSKDNYARNGWYIFTSSPHFSLFDKDPGYGQFFLSDDGILTIAVDNSSLSGCS
ncbi:MAG: hypothetical protein Q8O30_10585 [Candidatus Omnitrophota bacterium]|nr:hypothetical protein [Candidatus Omnitrophota bacterium]